MSDTNDMREAFEQEYSLIHGTSRSVLKGLRTANGYSDESDRIDDAYRLWLRAVSWHSQQEQGEPVPVPAGETYLPKVTPEILELLGDTCLIDAKDGGWTQNAVEFAGLIPVKPYPPAPAAVPEDLDNKVRAADRAEHPIAKETLISEAVEILDQLAAAPPPAETESEV